MNCATNRPTRSPLRRRTAEVRLTAQFPLLCARPATASTDGIRYAVKTSILRQWGLQMIGYIVSEGRLLSLKGTEWLMLLVGGMLAGSLLLF